MSDELRKWRDENLNTISECFCAAKWYNACFHLGPGYTNSCHLPLPHPIDPEEIKNNPAALHNTKHKKAVRKMMLEGRRPAECSYCWKIEDIDKNHISDRVFKSSLYTEEDIKKIKDIPWNDDVSLKSIEVSFDRVCNFACSYCNAGYSTTWGRDIVKNGPYQKFKTSSAGAFQSDGTWSEAYGTNAKLNPFVNAFLEWWPELSQTLDEIRVTGGEPAQSPNFWSFIDVMKKYPSDKLRLAVNSNLGISDKKMDKLIKMTHEVPIKEFDFYTSNESYGKHAEYIRDGLNYEKWRANVVKFIETAKFRSFTVMMTINSLCLLSITEFLDDMLSLRAKYGKDKIYVDLNILRWPAFMSPVILPLDIKTKLHDDIRIWFEKNRELLWEYEQAQVERLLDYIEVVKRGHNATELDIDLMFHDVKSFYTQYDKRRKKDFKKTFPELAEWYDGLIIDDTIGVARVYDGKLTTYESGEYVSDKNK